MNKTAKLLRVLATADPTLLAMMVDVSNSGETLPEPLANLTRPEVVEAVRLFPKAVELSAALGAILEAA